MLVFGNLDRLWSWSPEINVDTVSKKGKSVDFLFKETQIDSCSTQVLDHVRECWPADVIFFSRALLHNATKLRLTWPQSVSIFLPVLAFLVQLSDSISLYSSLLYMTDQSFSLRLEGHRKTESSLIAFRCLRQLRVTKWYRLSSPVFSLTENIKGLVGADHQSPIRRIRCFLIYTC